MIADFVAAGLPLARTDPVDEGAIAAVLLAITAARMSLGARLPALSAPQPFGAYPFLAITLLGWAWAHLRTRPARGTLRRELVRRLAA